MNMNMNKHERMNKTESFLEYFVHVDKIFFDMYDRIFVDMEKCSTMCLWMNV